MASITSIAYQTGIRPGMRPYFIETARLINALLQAAREDDIYRTNALAALIWLVYYCDVHAASKEMATLIIDHVRQSYEPVEGPGGVKLPKMVVSDASDPDLFTTFMLETVHSFVQKYPEAVTRRSP
jgi:hypothetical protein